MDCMTSTKRITSSFLLAASCFVGVIAVKVVCTKAEISGGKTDLGSFGFASMACIRLVVRASFVRICSALVLINSTRKIVVIFQLASIEIRICYRVFIAGLDFFATWINLGIMTTAIGFVYTGIQISWKSTGSTIATVDYYY